MPSVLHSSIPQPVRELPERHAAVRDAQFLFLTDRRQRAAVRRVVKNGVVPETMRADRRMGNLTFDRAARLIDHDTGVHDRHGAYKTGRARGVGSGGEAAVNLRKTLGIGSIGPQEAGGVNAGLPVHGVDFDAGILGNGVERTTLDRRDGVGDSAVVFQRLDACVFLERGAVFFRLRRGREIAKAQELDGKMLEQAANLTKFVAAGRGDNEAKQLFLLQVLANKSTLEGNELADPGVGEIEHLVERFAAERQRLRGPLELDIEAGPRLHDIHVDFRG
jgi:hypothetical protein